MTGYQIGVLPVTDREETIMDSLSKSTAFTKKPLSKYQRKLLRREAEQIQNSVVGQAMLRAFKAVAQ